MTPRQLRARLERIYRAYNHREFVSPDPLQFVYDYPNPADAEIAGLIAACLAFGTVRQILRSVQSVLERMPEPSRWIGSASPASMRRTFMGFRHRFVDGEDLCGLLLGVRRTIDRHGSLGVCFLSGFRDEDENVLPALTAFVDELQCGKNFLLPSPRTGSACKRLNLYLRWMLRRDEVDPGLWVSFPSAEAFQPASKLIVPLDTHMHRIALEWGLTKRTQGNMRTALEITEAFRKAAPDDPVRYDFSLTRLGIRKIPHD